MCTVLQAAEKAALAAAQQSGVELAAVQGQLAAAQQALVDAQAESSQAATQAATLIASAQAEAAQAATQAVSLIAAAQAEAAEAAAAQAVAAKEMERLQAQLCTAQQRLANIQVRGAEYGWACFADHNPVSGRAEQEAELGMGRSDASLRGGHTSWRD